MTQAVAKNITDFRRQTQSVEDGVHNTEGILHAAICLADVLVALTSQDVLDVEHNTLSFLCGQLRDRLESLKAEVLS